MSWWIDVLIFSLMLATAVHVVHASAAAIWMFRKGPAYRELLSRRRIDKSSPERANYEAIRDIDGGKPHFPLFFGVKSYRIYFWWADAHNWPIGLGAYVLRAAWRWPSWVVGSCVAVVAASLTSREWPGCIQWSLWVTALTVLVGMLALTSEFFFANSHLGSWAQAHHSLGRKYRDATYAPIVEMALWLVSVGLAMVPAITLVVVSGTQFNGYTGFSTSGPWWAQLWMAADIALPWIFPFASHALAITGPAIASISVINVVYITYLLVYLPTVLGNQGSRPLKFDDAQGVAHGTARRR